MWFSSYVSGQTDILITGGEANEYFFLYI